MDKRKILRIVLALSFTPYIFLIVYSLYYAIFGYDVYTLILPQYLRTVYGWDAFSEVFLWTGLSLSAIPIIPVCFLYQTIYFIRYLIKVIRSKGIQ
jgi:hypothetical protein